ncbi:hypothetical protein [Nonomuraea sp. NPDC003201]
MVAQLREGARAGVEALLLVTDGLDARAYVGVLREQLARPPLTLQNAAGDGSQEWRLAQRAPALDDLTRDRRPPRLIRANGVGERATVPLDAMASDPAGTALHANTTGHGYAFTAGGRVTDLGLISFGQAQQGSVTLPEAIKAGTRLKLAVVFDDSPLMWDSATAR